MGKRSLALLAFAALGASMGADIAAADQSYRVIVNPSVKGTQIPRAALNSIFLKQAPRWSDGTPVLPVDQSFRSHVRQSFSMDVHQRSLMELQMLWARRVASGVTPPPVKQSDAEIVSYVAATPGAIGYVTATTPLPDTVRVISIVD